MNTPLINHGSRWIKLAGFDRSKGMPTPDDVRKAAKAKLEANRHDLSTLTPDERAALTLPLP